MVLLQVLINGMVGFSAMVKMSQLEARAEMQVKGFAQ